MSSDLLARMVSTLPRALACGVALVAIHAGADARAEIVYLEGHTAPVYVAAYSPDGKFLVTGGFDKTVKIWDRASGTPTRTLADHTDMVLTLALARDGKQLATSGLDKVVLVYDFAALAAPVDPNNATPIAPRLKLMGHGGHVYSVDFSGDGGRLASASSDGAIKLWNTADGANYANCAGHTGQVYGVAFHPAQEQLASCGADKTVRLWQAADGKQIKEFKEGIADGLYSVAWSPDGAKLLAAGLAKTWHLWNTGEDKPALAVPGHKDYIYRAVFNPAGTRVATLGYTGALFIWDAATGSKLDEQKLPVRTAYGLTYSPDGTQLAITSVDNRVLLVMVPEPAR